MGAREIRGKTTEGEIKKETEEDSREERGGNGIIETKLTSKTLHRLQST